MRDTQHLFAPNETLPPDEAETSANFGIDELKPFMERLFIETGFMMSAGRIILQCELIAEIPLKESQRFETVDYLDGQLQLFTIHAFMRDAASPDLRFVSSQKLIDIINALIDDLDDPSESAQI